MIYMMAESDGMFTGSLSLRHAEPFNLASLDVNFCQTVLEVAMSLT